MVSIMSQHFLLSPAAKTLSLVKVMRMSHDEARDAFRNIRFADTDGAHIAQSAAAVKPTTSRHAKFISAKVAQSSTA